MPNYEYRCKTCTVIKDFQKIPFTFERLQPYGTEPITECPQCGGPVVRTFGAPAFIFKGGRPSKKRTVKQGQYEKPIHQTDDGHWEQDGIMDRR